jgi:hypothetical protein
MRYNATTLRKEKTAITQQIVEIIQSSGDPPGRFLEFDREVDGWVKVGDEVARRKVSHAIRYDSRYKKRKAPPETFEASVQEASTHRSDALRRGTARSGNHQERPGDRTPLVSDADILAGLGYNWHSSDDHDDAPVPWNLILGLGVYIQALEARASQMDSKGNITTLFACPATSSKDKKVPGIVSPQESDWFWSVVTWCDVVVDFFRDFI